MHQWRCGYMAYFRITLNIVLTTMKMYEGNNVRVKNGSNFTSVFDAIKGPK